MGGATASTEPPLALNTMMIEQFSATIMRSRKRVIRCTTHYNVLSECAAIIFLSFGKAGRLRSPRSAICPFLSAPVSGRLNGQT